MLFVLVMEVFGGLVRWCEAESIFTPLHCAAVRSRVSLYADDVVMFVIPADGDMIAVWTILRIFRDASGLYANMDKCVATPINCTPEDLQRVTDRLACSIGAFPCKYLGIPLSIRRLRSEEQFIIDAIATRIPLWKGHLLNAAGRAALVQATLSAIPVHLSIAVCLSTSSGLTNCGVLSFGVVQAALALGSVVWPRRLSVTLKNWGAGSAGPTTFWHHAASAMELAAQDQQY
jgi:hypothetical protein